MMVGTHRTPGAIRRNPWLWQYAAVFAATVLVAGFFATFHVDAHHDGILLKPAVDVSNGQALFRDSFTQYGALTTLLQAGAMNLFGRRLLVVRLLTAVFYGLSAMSLWHISTQIGSKKIALASWACWLGLAPYYTATFLPWSSVYALAFQLYALSLTITWVKTGRAWRLVLAGASAACSLWCRQPVGVLLLCASLCALAFVTWGGPRFFARFARASLAFLAGFVAVTALFLLWLVATSALRDMWLQSFRLAAAFADDRSGGFNLSSILRGLMPLPTSGSRLRSTWTVLPAITVCVAAVAIVGRLRRGPRPFPSAIMGVVAIVAIASWAQYFPVGCVRHWYWAATPMIPLAMCVFSRLCSRRSPRAYGIALTVLCLMTFGDDFAFRVESAWNRIFSQWDDFVVAQSPPVLRGMRIPNKQAALYEQLYAALEKHVARDRPTKLVVTGVNALYLTFVADNRNPHPMYVHFGFDSVYPDFSASFDRFVSEGNAMVLGRLGHNADRYDVVGDFALVGEYEGHELLYVPKPEPKRNAQLVPP